MYTVTKVNRVINALMLSTTHHDMKVIQKPIGKKVCDFFFLFMCLLGMNLLALWNSTNLSYLVNDIRFSNR